MIVRKFNMEKDFSVINGWWTTYHYSNVHPDLFPDNTFVALEGNRLLGCILMYLMDRPIMLMDHLTVSPHIQNPRIKLRVVDALIETARLEAKKRGYVLGMGHTKLSGFKKYHRKKGFTVTESNYSLIYGRV